MKAIERNIQIHLIYVMYDSSLKMPSTKYLSSSEVITTMKQTKKWTEKLVSNKK